MHAGVKLRVVWWIIKRTQCDVCRGVLGKKVAIVYYVFERFFFSQVCSVNLIVDGSNRAVYTIPEQERWFQPTACLLFLILCVYVQSSDKNINWQRDSWFAVPPPPPPTSDCHPIKVAYLSLSLNVSRWMINMYIQTGIRCQLCIVRDVTEDVTFKLKWWHSISGRLVLMTSSIICFCGVREGKKKTHNNNDERRNYPKGQIGNFCCFSLIYLYIYFLVGTHPCQS